MLLIHAEENKFFNPFLEKVTGVILCLGYQFMLSKNHHV